MTCIVGIVDGKNVWLGGDRAATCPGNLDRTIIKRPKIFVKNGIGIGVCGLPKVLDAIQHGIEFPVRVVSRSTKSFLVNDLVPAIRDGLKRFDCTEEFEGQLCFRGNLLIAHRGELHKVEMNFQLSESANNFDAVGCGQEPALGSLRSTLGMSAAKRIVRALEVSAENNGGVAPPFDVIKVK